MFAVALHLFFFQKFSFDLISFHLIPAIQFAHPNFKLIPQEYAKMMLHLTRNITFDGKKGVISASLDQTVFGH
jgi:hypothetical protein